MKRCTSAAAGCLLDARLVCSMAPAYARGVTPAWRSLSLRLALLSPLSLPLSLTPSAPPTSVPPSVHLRLRLVVDWCLIPQLRRQAPSLSEKGRVARMEAKPTFMENLMRTKPLAVIHAEESSADLPRSLSLFDLICIGVGGTVGSGVFATTGDIISGTAGPAAVVSWIVSGVVVCINALSYMELTTRVPSSGSTYAYSYHAIGELPAVIAAWLITLEYGVSGSGVARSWATKVQEWLVDEHPEHTYQWLNEDYTNLLGALIMALCVGILLMGVRFGKWFVNVITSIKVVVVLFIIIAGFAVMDTKNLSPFVPERQEVDGSMTYGAQGIITGASQAFFGYIGFDEVCCLAAEAKNPKRTMPLAVVGVVALTMFLSVFASLVLSGMVYYADATSFGTGFEAQGLHWAAEIVRAGETITMPVVVLVSFLAQPRLNYALACDGLMPKIFAKVDDKGNLFVNTLLTGIFFTVVAFVVPFDTLWDIVSFGILLSFNMSNTALMMVRTRKESPTLAPRLIGGIVVFSFLAAFLYQIGYSNEGHDGCLYAAIIFLVLTVITCITFYIKCPQEPNDPANFTAPLVPFIPTIAMVLNFYLAAQISYLGIETSVAWIAAAVVSYFAYGYTHSAGRTGWSTLMSLPRDSTMRSPMISDGKKLQE
jgi:amino acid transporter